MNEAYCLHVAVHGDDDADGTASRPLRSAAAALQRVLAAPRDRPATIRFADGIHHLDAPLRIGREHGRSAAAPLVLAAAPGTAPVLSGAQPWPARWTPAGAGLWQCPAPEGDIDGLVVDGQPMPLAAYPKQGWSSDALDSARTARWSDPRGGYVHALHKARWGGMHFRITGRSADGGLEWEGGWQNNRGSEMNRRFLRVEGIVEELTDPGEWCLDRSTGLLLHRPAAGVDLVTAQTALVRLRHLVELDGASHVVLRGLTLRHAARTFMETREPLLRSDWTMYRGGALVLRGSEGCRIEDCTVEQCGGNGIVLDGRNHAAVVRGCLLRDLGASGVALLGAAGCERACIPGFHREPDLADAAPGPRDDAFPERCLVEDCLIQRIGLVEKQSAGVHISRSRRITVRNCTVHDVPRAGINIGEGTFGGHLIEGCDVFATVLETSDHGAFNSWGRDRFWCLDRPRMQALVDAAPGVPYLDAALTNVLRCNRWRCDHGWDIDLDDGSGNYLIEGNVCLRGGIKLREGYGRTVINNLMIGCTLHPHVWQKGSGDVIQRNIVMRPYAPIGMPPTWGASWDANLLATAEDLARSRVAGRDLRSLAGAPGFIDPEHADYRLRADSPARDLGWQDIAMDDFGVRSPRLRALADRPAAPDAGVPVAEPVPAPSAIWLGAQVRAVTTVGEMSAAALPLIGGILVTGVPPCSDAERAGLATMDVIVAIDGEVWPELPRLLAARPPLELMVRRFGTDRQIRVAGPAAHR